MSRPTHSPSPSHTGADDAQQALATLRLSEEGSERRPLVNGSSTSLNGINGKGASVGLNGTPTSDVDALRQELEDVRAENESLQTQYQSLVSRVQTMKTALGNKLKQDIVRCLHFCTSFQFLAIDNSSGRAGEARATNPATNCTK